MKGFFVAFIDKTHVVPEFRLSLPLYIGGKSRQKLNGSFTKPTKKYWLTLNNYRNWHHQTANNTKVLFKKYVQDQISTLPDLSSLWGPVCFHYTLFPPNHANRDLNNSVSIIDKYFADALVEMGKLTDDNFLCIPAYSCEVSNIDKLDPRMEVAIRPFVNS